MSDESTTPGPGWYPDPSAPGRQRYWDGTSWTEYTDENYAEKTGVAAPGTGVGVSSWPSTPQEPGTGVPASPAGQQPWVAPAGRTSGIAIGALISGIISIVTCFLAGGVIAGPVAIVLGVRANRQIRQDPSLSGSGLATAGLVTGIIGTLLSVIFLIVWISAFSSPLFWEEFNREFNA